MCIKENKMLNFTSYLIESRNGSLSIWDIDETLFKTKNVVNIMSGGKVVKTLSNTAFNNYTLKSDESYDFSDFSDSDSFVSKSSPYKKLIRLAGRILKRYLGAGNSKMIILTARGDMNDKEKFLQAFRKFGLNIDHVYVERAGNTLTGGAISEKKATIIRRYLNQYQYSIVNMFDDDIKNLKKFLALSREYPGISFNAYLAREGTIRRLK